MRCPQCDNKLLQKTEDATRVRIKGALLLKADGTAVTQCYWCNTTVTIPIGLSQPVSVEAEATRFVLRPKT